MKGDAPLGIERQPAQVNALAQPSDGTCRAVVGHAAAQGMSAQATHARRDGSRAGVPAASPSPAGSLVIA